jgi:hypothetical protein
MIAAKHALETDYLVRTSLIRNSSCSPSHRGSRYLKAEVKWSQKVVKFLWPSLLGAARVAYDH